MRFEYDWIQSLCEPAAGLSDVLAAARERVAADDFHHAAAAYDLAYGLDPAYAAAAAERAALLDRLEVVEHGLRFRYVPGGTFRMGSAAGDPDERPVHPVELPPFWLTETPVSWTDYCRLLGWTPPPHGQPKVIPVGEDGSQREAFWIRIRNQIRLQYCETETVRAIDWHAHHPEMRWGKDGEKTSRDLFGLPPRRNPDAPWSWDQKPVVAVGWQDAEELGAALSSPGAQYSLPTEAEWEKAARGGLSGCRYAWGDEPPAPERCDFDRMREFSIRPPRELPPNGYGLYGMCGGVWEWTADWYDACFYHESPRRNPTGPERGEERVLRGGSWADRSEGVTVSFRMSRASSGWWEQGAHGHHTPNIGFRLARREVADGAGAVSG